MLALTSMHVLLIRIQNRRRIHARCLILSVASGSLKVISSTSITAMQCIMAQALKTWWGLTGTAVRIHCLLCSMAVITCTIFFRNIIQKNRNGLLPAETMYEVHNGHNGGWPYVYYDQFQHRKIVSPKYGGDGKKTGGENALDPIFVFPAHLAPNGLMFYTGKQFPAKYKNGAFIALHARSPELQKGYLVAFVPFNNGKPSGDWQIFRREFYRWR